MTREIVLAGGEIALVDDEDYELVVGYRWRISLGYARANSPGGSVAMHRLVMGAKDGQLIDHANRRRLDNRKCNLRLCSRAENSWNRKRQVNNTCGFRGVHLEKYSGLWRARIQFNKKKINLGNFDSPELAHAAYMQAAKRYFGAFAPQEEPNLT